MGEALRLIEIKKARDPLRDHQRAWILLLTTVGVKVEIW